MSKLGSALGKKYEDNKLSILTRTFELGNHTFKVRVPSVKEIEAVYDYFKNPNEQIVEEIYQDLTKDLIKFKDEANDNVEFKDNDIVVDGRSIREAAKNKSTIQHRIVEYIKLIIPEDGQSLEGIEYKDIEEEFPLAIQLTLVDKINEVIAPDYKDTRLK
jgi:hypothetical protein